MFRKLKLVEFNINCVLVMLLTITALCTWKLRYSFRTKTTVEGRPTESAVVQLTTDEMTYILGTSNHSIEFDKYLQYIRSHIVTPSTSKPPSTNWPKVTSLEVSQLVDKILKQRRNGFFIECGAADGTHSQTQFMELERNWTGLLVEANQRYFNDLLNLNRQAYIFGGCLTPTRPKRVKFLAGGGHGLSEELKIEYFHKMLIHSSKGQYESEYLVQCFPLNHLLASIGVNHVHFFSFDIQGGEPVILEAMDFNALRIDVILIEVEHGVLSEREILRNNMRVLFNKTGLYDEAATLDNDMIFKRKDIYSKQ